jgi:hypothetical protein
MLKGNIIEITHEGLDENIFVNHPVWCDYHSPDEIDYLESLGENREFLVRELVDFEELENSGKTYYSLPETWDREVPEFAYASTELEINGNIYRGYLCLVEGEINAVAVFQPDEAIDLYVNKLLSDDNREGLARLGVDFSREDVECLVRLSFNESFWGINRLNQTKVIIPLEDT